MVKNDIPVSMSCDRAARALHQRCMQRITETGSGVLYSFSPMNAYTLKSTPSGKYGILELLECWKREGALVEEISS